MKEKVHRDIAQSVNARLKNQALREGVNVDYLFLKYAIERFLYRLSISAYGQHFVLKGAATFSVWLGPMFRVTRDTELAYFKGVPDEADIKHCFQAICRQPVTEEDGIAFDAESVALEQIKKGDRYNGLRVTLLSHLAQARLTLQFDIGFGDAIFPEPQLYDYPTLLSFAAPRLRLYPHYTVIAEKLEAIVALGMLNSRLKDYFDIWLLIHTFVFDYNLLLSSIQKTFRRRRTALPKACPIGLTATFSADATKQTQWAAFLRKTEPKERPASLTSAVEEIATFLEPVFQEASPPLKQWNAQCGWQ